MSSTWIDPVDALVGFGQGADGEWFWVVVHAPTNFLDDPSVQVGSESTHLDARLAAVAYLTKEYANVPLNIYSADEQLTASIQALGAWPNMEVHASTRLRTHRLAHLITETLEDTAGPEGQVIVSCDGSFSVSRRTGGWAWVNEQGEYGQGSGSALSPTHAELKAISLALKNHAKDSRKLLVKADSREAISLIVNGARENTPVKLRRELAHIRSSSTFARCTFEWVAGHSGDPLNEAANRLAIAARRDADAQTAQEVSTTTAQAIVSEHMGAYAEGTKVPATAKIAAAYAR